MVSITTREGNLNRMHEGRHATVIAGLVKPYIDNKVTLLVHEMCNAYRSREATHEFLLGKTAEVTALLNLMADLERAYKLGVNASKQEIGNGS